MDLVYGIVFMTFLFIAGLVYNWMKENHLLLPLAIIIVIVFLGLIFYKINNMPERLDPNEDIGGMTRGDYESCIFQREKEPSLLCDP